MAYYTDNRFDRNTSTKVSVTKPIGPRGRHATLTINAVALPGYPGWSLVTSHADYDHSQEATTRDPLALATHWAEAWEDALNRQFR